MTRTQWPRLPISEVCEIAVDCVNKTAPSVDYETPFKMIRTTNVKRGFVDTEDVKYVTEEVFTKWTRRSQPQPGDVILTREAPLGEVGRFRSEDQVMLGQRLFHYRANPSRIHPEFLAYVLQSPEVQGRIRSKGFGATVEHARVGDCENLLIPVPDDLGIQGWIGTTLAAYDDLIENNRRRIKLLEDAARLIYREWFVRLRFPGHEHTKIENGLPEGWEKAQLRTLAEVIRGRSYKGSELSDSEGRQFVNLKCFVRYGGFRESGLKRYTGPAKEAQTVSAGDIVMAVTDMTQERMIVAHAARIPLTVEPGAVISMDVVKIAPNDRVDKDWLYFFLRYSGFSELVSRYGTGATVVHLSPALIKDHICTVPSEDVQGAFGGAVRPLTEQTDTLLMQNRALERARDLLLPRLMSGEIEV